MYGRFLGAALMFVTFTVFCATAEGKVPRKMTGKIFFTTERIMDQDTPALVRLFAKRKTSIELLRPKKKKDSRWKVTMVAFFRKAAVDGPITIWLYDKADKASIRAKEPVNAISVDTKSAKNVFIHDLEINPDLGFNRKHTYILFVGQIIGKRVKHYAKGEVSLK